MSISLEFKPGLRRTTLIARSEGRTLLRARLGRRPWHPRAPRLLCRALSLWEGSSVHVVLVAEPRPSSSATRRVLALVARYARALFRRPAAALPVPIHRPAELAVQLELFEVTR